MMKQVLFAVLIAVVAGYVGAKFAPHQAAVSDTRKQETAYERVLRTKTLRCGYALWPPIMMSKDVNTGKLDGVFHDMVEELAQKLSLKVEWVEETGWANWIEGLKANRFDMFCAGVWQNGARGREVGFSLPLFYSPVYAYARVDDTRFNNGFAVVNDPSIRVSGMDGEISEVIARTHFPNAQYVGMPQISEISFIFLNVANKKADIVFNEPGVANDFIFNNPGKLKQISEKPFQIFKTAYGVKITENALLQMIDSALIELHNDGITEKILSKYDADPTMYLRISKPYVLPSQTEGQ